MSDFFNSDMKLFLDHRVDWARLIRLRRGPDVDAAEELAVYKMMLESADGICADLAEITINAKALSAGRNLLFANIKDPNQRPFKDVPDLAAYMDMSFAKKALSDLEAERKAAAAKPPETPKEAAPEKKPETPAAKPEVVPA